MASAMGAGCVWPQDDQVLPEIPPRRNSPPRILLNTVTPQLDTNVGPNCRPAFSFNVEDPDTGDLIRNRWFVFKQGEARTLYFDGRALQPSTTAVRQTRVVAPDALFSAASELVQNGEHRLEVVIADGELGEGATPLPRTRGLPDGGTVDDPTYIDSFVWFVNTSDTTPPCQ